MPEGPEIHFAADQLAKALVGEPLQQVRFAAPALKRYERTLKGHAVTAVEARGKAMLTHFDNGLTLYSHNQLLGYWTLRPTVDAAAKAKGKANPAKANPAADDAPPAVGTGRKPGRAPLVPKVSLSTASTTAAVFIAPKVEIWKTVDIEAHPFLARLGPDVLGPDTTPADYMRLLDDPKLARRVLAVLLLDQGFAAGMGNYLRSEVLFAARLAPMRKVGELTRAERTRLSKALITVPARSYRHRFSLGSDYLADTRTSFELKVFDRAGQACPGKCGGKIREERLAGRRLYWCPACQK